MIRLEEGRAADAPPLIPYFPLDGAVPADPGHNFYGLSKEFGERTLRILSEHEPKLACTALRFPMLTGDWFRKHFPAQALVLAGHTVESTLREYFPHAAAPAHRAGAGPG